jgi:hypothetical protein
MVRRRATLLLLACAGGCKLTEVVNAPPGDPVIVVQGVLNTAVLRQTVLVQQSASGDTTTGISGASVLLTDLDPRGCATPAVQLVETTPGVYRSADFCPLAPGDRLTLSVHTQDGHIVTGATRVPGVGSIVVRAGSTTAHLPPAALAIDRTRDSLFFTVGLVDARALQIEAVRTTAGEDPTLSFTTDTTSVSVAGNLVDLSGSGRSIFRAGAYYEVTAAAMDTNYFDFVRSFTNPLTGRGFINHLSGAVGVFGSVAPLTYELRVTAPRSDPREGVYHLTGHVSGMPVDVTWDVYGDPIATSFRAFVDGQWTAGPVHTSANGSYVGTTFSGTMFGATDTDTPNPTFFLAGTRPAQGTPFPVLVTPASGPPIVDTLTALQVSGP